MAYGYNDPFVGGQPPVQIQKVGGWKLLAGAMLAAAGVGFAGYIYVVPYQKVTRVLRARTGELGKERGATQDLEAERDRLKDELAKRNGADQDKAANDAKQRQALEALAAELKIALAAVGANISADEGKVRLSFGVPALFEQPTSTVISPQGETALKVVIAGMKKSGLRAKVKAKLIQSAPPRELAQFKNIGEFQMLRAARIMLVLANNGVPADHVSVIGEVPGGRKTKNGVPDRLDIEIEPE